MASPKSNEHGDFFVGVLDGVDAVVNALAEFVRFGAELLVGKLFHRRLERVDLLDERQDTLDLAFVTGAENCGNYFVKQCGYSLDLSLRRARAAGRQPETLTPVEATILDVRWSVPSQAE